MPLALTKEDLKELEGALYFMAQPFSVVPLGAPDGIIPLCAGCIVGMDACELGMRSFSRILRETFDIPWIVGDINGLDEALAFITRDMPSLRHSAELAQNLQNAMRHFRYSNALTERDLIESDHHRQYLHGYLTILTAALKENIWF